VAAGDDTRHHVAHIRAADSELVVETFGFATARGPLELVDRFTIVRPPATRVGS